MSENYSAILCLVNDYYDIQETRIRTENRIRSFVQGVSPQQEEFVKELVLKSLVTIEKRIVRYLSKELQSETLWAEWLENVKGIGPVLAAGLIGWIEDIDKFATISKLWKYSGLAVAEDGKAMRREKGKKLCWNPRMKVLSWKCGESFVKQKDSGYRDLYEKFREYYDKKWKTSDDCGSKGCANKGKALKKKGKKVISRECMKGHRYAAAKRKTVKVFFAHVHMRWNELKGNKPSHPFIMGREGHSNEIKVIEE